MTSSRLNRIYHPYWKWEETKSNMWGRVDDREWMFKKMVAFTGDHRKYGAAMMRVVREWKYSCEHNLSDVSQNRRAWLGHAACALAHGAPEDIVRQAWQFLSDEQRRRANEAADRAIKYWEKIKFGGSYVQEEFGF